ncbi:hypothetical protein [Sphingobacterium faecium]|uniref:hypothetical protein n=1 Tax=Sphingobacterium faecium TaxID=34087 RepID=UPI003209E06C
MFETNTFYPNKYNGVLIAGYKNNMLFYEKVAPELLADPKIIQVDWRQIKYFNAILSFQDDDLDM